MAGIKEKLNEIKAVEDTLTLNKVARFAYTDEAYETNDANGVSDYDVNRQQNIPVANSDILKVNETILSKGYRSQASSLTRMLVNHFFGRISYNLNKLNDNMSDLLSGLSDSLGKPEGIATLDAEGRIPYSQLPESAMEYKGTWDASANTPSLADGTGNTGDFYFVSVAGTHDFGSGEITFLEGDRVLYDGSSWQKLTGGSVKSVNGTEPDGEGNITLDTFGTLNVTDKLNLKGTPIEDLIEGAGTVKSVNGTEPDGEGNITLDTFGTLNVTDKLNLKGTSVEELIKRTASSVALMNWIAVPDMKFDFDAIKSIVYLSGVLRAVGENGKAAYSENLGDTWRAISDPNFLSVSINGIAYGNGTWIAVGASGKASRSTNGGGIWTAISDMGFGSMAINSIAYNNGKFIAVGNSGKATYSISRGATWTAVSDIKFGTSTINRIAYGNGAWIAVGASGKVSRSTSNGTIWFSITIPDATAYNFYAIAHGNNRWILGGSSGKAFYSDDNGATWTAISDTKFYTNTIYGIAYGNGRWVAVGDGGYAAYSDDNGKTWTRILNTKFNKNPATIYGITYCNGRWIAAGASGQASYSLYLPENT